MRNKRLTLKQRQFVTHYIEKGGNGTKAAMAVYDTNDPHTAHQIAYENLRKPAVVKSIELSLERAGLDDNSVSELLREATIAGLGSKATNADTLRGIDMILKLKDSYPTQKTAHLRVDMREKYEKMDYDELLKELSDIRKTTEKILEDSEN